MKTHDYKEAVKEAKKISANGYSCIVRTGTERAGNVTYYVEDETPFLRNNEELVAEFEDGKRI